MNQQVVVLDTLVSFFSLNAQSDGTPLVFLHGWRSEKQVWQGIVERLEVLGRPIYALDLPGFGASALPKTEYGLSNYALVVGEFLQKKQLSPAVVIGHSFGGRVAIRLAAEHPELVKRLVLADSAGFKMPQAKKTLLNAAAKLVRPLFRLSGLQGVRKKIYESLGAEDYLATPQLQRTFVRVINEDLSAEMQKIACPTLIVYGEADTATPPEFGRRMQSLIAGSRLEILSSAGHYSFLDQPEKFSQLISQFIEQ